MGFFRMGNEAYKKQNFEKAIDLYSKAIDAIRDSPVLYCNRALAYIKWVHQRKVVRDIFSNCVQMKLLI